MEPRTLDFPPHFEEFRPAQLEAFEHCLTSETRFTGIGAPPGVGKSGIAYGLAKLFGGTTRILTANRGLQDQYNSAGFPGLIDMRGRSNFQCWEGGNCEEGARLDCKDHAGCPYKEKLRVFNMADVAVSNYAFWLSGGVIAMPDTLICDEAHLIFDWLSQALDFYIGERECRAAGETFGHVPGSRWRHSPIPDDSIESWTALGPAIIQAATQVLSDARAACNLARTDKNRERVRKATQFVERAQKLRIIEPDNWVCTLDEGTDAGRLWRFECVWPYKHRERVFQRIPRVILMGATLRPKTFALNGISKLEYDFREWPRQFPLANGPVIWLKTVRVNSKITVENEKIWLHRIAEVCRWGNDRNGLIHTVSYARARLIHQFLSNQGFEKLIVNGAADPETATAREAYNRFCQSPAGTVLISPSFSTGWDFKRKIAEWQVIAKLPLVDTRSKVMQARVDGDRNYPAYLAAQELAQACGRINRDEDDLGTTLILDDSWSWFQGMAKEYLPRWFKVRPETQLPRPLRLLT